MAILPVLKNAGRPAFTLWNHLFDFLSRFLNGKLHTIPPRRLRDVGGGDFELTGREFRHYFVTLADLKAGDQVLEIGCGCGRMALPLTSYLADGSRYVGFDVVKDSIVWCRKHITKRYPNFEFHYSDIYNLRYNPLGRRTAREFQFPFGSQMFDFVFLTSVFTHLLRSDLEHYLNEISRLTKKGGNIFMTFFLLNPEQRMLAEAGRNQIVFLPYDHGVMVRDVRVPESAVAYDEGLVRAQSRKAGLVLREPVHYGTWSGRDNGLSFQDLLIAFKDSDEARRHCNQLE
jgi:SAM-dependent methyltransferase